MMSQPLILILFSALTSPIRFAELGVDKFANPAQAVFALDHNVQDTSGIAVTILYRTQQRTLN